MAETHRLAVCPGSFDPLTNGHLDLILRGARMFDRLVVAVLGNPSKRPWFSIDERMDMVREVLAGSPEGGNVEVDTFNGLLAGYVQRRSAVAIVRGLRAASEFADEAQMAAMNRHLFAGCETAFLVSLPAVAHVSSRLVREVAELGGSLDGLVPPAVALRLARRRSAAPPVRV